MIGKIIGLYVVVFSCALINAYLGFSDIAVMVGTVVGAGIYILGVTQIKEAT